MKDSFVSFSSTVLKTLAVEAPVIGLDNTTFQSKVKLPVCLFLFAMSHHGDLINSRVITASQ